MTLDPSALRLYLVADPDQCATPLMDAVRRALQSGVTAVQLRAKRLSDREHLDLARDLRALCQANDSVFIVNDRVDIALLASADGVHVGASDIGPNDIREVVPEEFIIGYSPDSESDYDRGAQADYVGIGPVFGTSSKLDAGEALGLDEFSRRTSATHVPVVGIGGIAADNALSVLEAGACGVAVISSILRAPDVSLATRRLRNALEPPAP